MAPPNIRTLRPCAAECSTATACYMSIKPPKRCATACAFWYGAGVTTIYDVARAADCAASTVSRALANDRRISESTRIRVHETARRLGYRSNPIARALSQGRTKTIGLVLPKLDAEIFSAGTALLHDQLSHAGYRIVLCCHGEDPSADLDALRSLIEYNVDAIIHVPSTKDGAHELIGMTDIPVVELIRRSDATGVDAVVADRELGSFELVRHLVDLGHRRITLFTRFDHRGVAEAMAAGFERAIRDFKLDHRDCPIHAISMHDSATAALDDLLDSHQPHTAIVAANTELSYALLRAVQRRKISVPAELSIAAFLNANWCEITSPTITAYEIPLQEIGLLAAQVLLNRLEPRAGRTLSHSVVRCAGRLVVRESTGPPRA